MLHCHLSVNFCFIWYCTWKRDVSENLKDDHEQEEKEGEEDASSTREQLSE